MATVNNLGTVHVFRDEQSFDKNMAGMTDNDVALVRYPNMDFVVESWRNGTEWYRRWSDGWVEQGGNLGAQTGGWATAEVTYHVPFKDLTYTLFTHGNWSEAQSSSCWVSARTTTGCTVRHANNYYSVLPSQWYACGQGAPA